LFKLSVMLKQHTPMIHFQCNQKGATLRATELKPKLDKFIKNDLKIIAPEIYCKYKDIIDEYFSIEDNIQSPYKIKIFGEIDRIKCINRMPYFGEGHAVEFKNGQIKLNVFSFNKDIIELIKEIIPYVFLFNNFGTRQNKGFGSFTVESINDTPIDLNYDEIFKKKGNVFKKIIKNNKRHVVQIVNGDYQRLKSGINKPYEKSGKNKPYEKSLLFQYMCKKGISWEKRKIKTELKKKYPEIFNKLKYTNNNSKNHKIEKCSNITNKYDERYIRAMLGLAGNHIYLLKKRKPTTIKIQSTSDEKIERFKSPITFKIIDNTIYAIPEKINEKIYGAKFKFSINGKKLFEISTPSKDEFDLIDFLDSEYGLKELGYTKI